jgi:hypothetical protein
MNAVYCRVEAIVEEQICFKLCIDCNNDQEITYLLTPWRRVLLEKLKARLYGSPRLINAVESMELNSTVERFCLHGSTKVNEAVDSKLAAKELVRGGVVVMCDSLMKECQHILEKINERKKNNVGGLSRG